MEEVIVPDFEWYAAKSRVIGTTPRCPYASASRCPRYFVSLSLMGEAGATKMDPNEKEKLKDRWSKTDLWPNIAEQDTGIFGSGSSRTYVNFCPEVTFDIFGYFASSLGDFGDEIDRDAAFRRLERMNLPAGDWRWRWSFLTPAHYSGCRLYSLLNVYSENHMDSQTRAYLERRLGNVVEGVVEDCMMAVSNAMTEATRNNALGNSRVWLSYNSAILDTVKAAIPSIVHFVYDAANGHSPEASGLLDSALTQLIDAAVAAFVERTQKGAKAFGEQPLYVQLRLALTKLKDEVIDDFDNGFEGGKRLTNQSHSGISVTVTGSPGAQVAAGRDINQNMNANAKLLVNAVDDVLISDSFKNLNSDQSEIIRSFADLVKEELRKPKSDITKIKGWTERIKLTLEGAKLAVEASKIGSALISFLSAMG